MMPSERIPAVAAIGAGLAGSECAYQLLRRGVDVLLIDMRPHKKSPAHHTGEPAELVCSNSFRSLDVMNAVGLLKEEMLSLDSLVMNAAYRARVPAGSALAVDRDAFSAAVKAGLSHFPNLTTVPGEVLQLQSHAENIEILTDRGSFKAKRVVLATGPLTAETLAKWIGHTTDAASLYFYDAIAPIVMKDSVDMRIAFRASRYDKNQANEGGDYINCPMTEVEYNHFISEILKAELVEVHDFDKAQFFEGCLPIEVMASRGVETLRYGPMKPVGLTNPHQPDEKPHAVVQLRQDNRHGTLLNLVGFQTRLKYGEQKRIFGLIPGLQNAEFARLGSMHRNTYLCSPRLLQTGMQLKTWPGLHFAGQITGCEGYLESAAVGLYVGGFLAQQLLQQRDLPTPPATTALGALIHHLLHGDPEHYQPMNVNFGLFADLPESPKKRDRKTELVRRAFQDFRVWQFDCWNRG